MQDDLTSVYKAQTLMEAQLLSDQLKSAGIESFIDHAGGPFDGLVAADQVKVVRVLPADAEKAQQIVAAFEAEKEKE